MKDIPDGSVDMILCDLPYGITSNKWDSLIPMGELWKHYLRVGKENAIYAFTSNQPFTKEQLGSFSVATAIGYRGTGQTGFEILTAGDLNKDGYDDLVISCRLDSNPEKDGEMKVLVLFFNPNTKVFEFNEKIQSNLSASLFPRRAAV
jgi:hypothetical protein